VEVEIMRTARILILVETALAVALAVVLNLLTLRLPINVAGGSISLTMLPIAVLALRRGPIAGLTAGALFGLLDLLMEPFILVPAQVALDYPVPYLLFGLGVGLFAGLYQKAVEAGGQSGEQSGGSGVPSGEQTGGQAGSLGTSPKGARILASSTIIVIALLVGGILRAITHVLSGVIFFAEYAGDQNVWVYSIVYNISYLGPSLTASLICALIISPILARAVPIMRPVPSLDDKL
jgi:thiamine transporter